MVFTLRGKTNQTVRLLAATSVGGGVGFALVDKFAVQQIPSSTLDATGKKLLHAGIGIVISLLGIASNRMWVGQLGAGYTAVPISQFAADGLAQIPTGFARPSFAQFPTGLIVNGRTQVGGAPISGVKTF